MTEDQFAMLERFSRHGFKGCTEGEKHRIRVTLMAALELARAGQLARDRKNRKQARWREKVKLQRALELAKVPPSVREPVAQMPPEYWPTTETR